MRSIYVAAPGVSIPGGWPEEGRAIDSLSRLHRNFVRDGDLIPKPASRSKPKPDLKKDLADGK